MEHIKRLFMADANNSNDNSALLIIVIVQTVPKLVDIQHTYSRGHSCLFKLAAIT